MRIRLRAAYTRGRFCRFAALALALHLAARQLIAQIAPPDYRYKPPSYGYGSVHYDNAHAATTSSFSRGQVVNTNPTSAPTGGTSSLYASRSHLPSENRLATREQQLQGMLPSEQRHASYLGTPAGGGYTPPPTHYTDYLGTLNYRKPAAPPAPRAPSAYRAPTGVNPYAGGAPTGVNPYPGAAPVGTVRYGSTQPVSSIAQPSSIARPISSAPAGAGSVRYGQR